ncbi:uncharacterized oxidoreductase YjmC-like [Bradysia coprophila]|uniref:uncharacterized oxidoreductase YjmC-like n=1 Tax=Bradysia coprophila TaxID=38358 RepID=UPI00187D75DB|nr:uncharacterized oxidoreductase YjmC-like [Bradysia coprophila]XP_037045190.1 uncharacterized oxidoreductase YjmC-like [Bradysia coprophila]
MKSTKNQLLVSVEESRRFMIDCFSAAKIPRSHAEQMADLLVAADYRGHYSHGMNRLEMYINELDDGTANGSATPTILKQTPATAWVDGENGLGAVVGNFCMDLAIKKAKNIGVGWVCAKRSNHYGIAGWYSLRAMNKGLMGISMTNTSPLMTPTRSKQAALGTNPISFAAPANNGDSFVLDMATTAVAGGKIEIKMRKNEPCPIGWAQDVEGNPTTDPHVAFDAGCLMPLGGAENTSGYKGYGLGVMVDIMCGISSGSNYSTKVRKWAHSGNTTEANLGHVFIAIDPDCFAPGFTDRMTEMIDICRSMPRIDPELPVLIAGDPERIHMENVDKEGGLRYTENQLQTCEKLVKRLSVKPLSFV